MIPSSETPVISTVPVSAPKKKGGCGCVAACVLIPLALLAMVGGVVLWLTAAAGFFRVPLFTSLAYKEPAPVHRVDASRGVSLVSPSTMEALSHSDALDPKALEDVLRRLSAFSLPSLGGKLAFDIPEGALTATLRQSGAQSTSTEKPVFDFATAQIAVTKSQGLEVFLPLANNALHSAVRFHLRLFLESASLQAEITDAWLGNLHLPAAFVKEFSDKAVQGALRAAGPALKGTLILSSLRTDDGAVHVEAALSPM